MLSPLSARAFSRLIEPLGPFERAPRVAVAVSGGPDSLALCLLADRWATAHGGSVLALTVDHGLRPEAAQEARQVGRWLAARGIAHRVLRWTGSKPRSGVQEAARRARYALLEAACREAGILHLLLAHHQADQAETVAFRAVRSSGPAGLAGMSAIVERPQLRLLRPLLPIPRTRLLATLRALGQTWLDDPSNRDPRFARTRIREALTRREVDRLSTEAVEAGTVRVAADTALAGHLARCAYLDPGGFAVLDAELWAAPGEPESTAILQRAVLCIGGGPYAPRSARLARLVAELRRFGARAPVRTLGGCLIGPWRDAAGRSKLVVAREPAAAAPPVELSGAGPWPWDGRFLWAGAALPGTSLEALQVEGWAALPKSVRRRWAHLVPPPARGGLPALRDGHGILRVPRLEFSRNSKVFEGGLRFCPRHRLAPAAFMLAQEEARIMSSVSLSAI